DLVCSLSLHDALPISLIRVGRLMLPGFRGSTNIFCSKPSNWISTDFSSFCSVLSAAESESSVELSFDSSFFPSADLSPSFSFSRSEEHTSELQSRENR